MRVKAVRQGFFGMQLRVPNSPNAVFDCPVDKLGRWMEPLEPMPAKPSVDKGEGAGAGKTLADALARLDPDDDAHWTKPGPKSDGGLPALPVLSEYLGARVTRQMVEEAAPGFDRNAARAAKGAAVDGGAGA